MTQIVDAMAEVRVEEGEFVVRQGEKATAFYIVGRGSYEFYVHEDDDVEASNGIGNFVDHIDGKGYFGEYDLIAMKSQSMTVIALTNGFLWSMDRISFRRVVAWKRRMFADVMHRSSLLDALDEMEKLLLCTALLRRVFDDGHLIIHQGDVPGPSDGMYFIESGEAKVTIFVDDGKAETEVARLGVGKYFGEMALLKRNPRSANVYAAGPMKTAFLEQDAFEGHLSPWLDILNQKTKSYKISPPDGRG